MAREMQKSPERELYWRLVQEASAAAHRLDHVSAWALAGEATRVWSQGDDDLAEPLAAFLLIGHLQNTHNIHQAGVDAALKAGAVVNWPDGLEPQREDQPPSNTSMTVH